MKASNDRRVNGNAALCCSFEVDEGTRHDHPAAELELAVGDDWAMLHERWSKCRRS